MSGSIGNENLLLHQENTDTLQIHEFHYISVATIPFSQKQLHHDSFLINIRSVGRIGKPPNF